MAEISQIVQEQSYRGDANLFGYGAPILIDVKPLDDLARYTMIANKADYDQRQKDTDAKVLELAKLATINLNDLHGKDKDEVSKSLNDLITYASEYARKSPKNQEEKIQQQLEWQTNFGKVKGEYDSAKQRSIGYHSQIADIEKTYPDAKQQDIRKKQLEDYFGKTKLSDKISAVAPMYEIKNIDTPTASTLKTNIVQKGVYENVDAEITMYIPKVNASLATATVMGLNKLYPQKGTQEYERLSENEKSQVALQETSEGDAKIWSDSASEFNSALKTVGVDGKPLYFDIDGKFLSKKFEDDNYSYTVVMKPYTALKNLDTYSKNKIEQFSKGELSDKGFNFSLPQGVSVDDFKAGLINFEKGISPDQLVQAGIFSKFKGDDIGKVVQLTDDNIKKRGQDLDYGLGIAQLNQRKKEWGATQGGTETQKNGAMIKAQRIYNDLKQLADKNGVISPDKVRQLNSEQLKYMGIEEPTIRDEDGTITQQGGFKPLDLKGRYAIQLDNGEVKVMGVHPNKKDIEFSKDGSLIGLWDNTRSTNIYNMGTNILNEAVKNSAGKELSAYWGVDVTGSATIDKNTTNSTSSGNSSTGPLTIPTLKTKAEFDALPSGSFYYREGKKYQK